MTRCYFFGCWNKAGHFLREGPGTPRLSYEETQKVELFTSHGERHHLDGSLAPRAMRDGSGLCWGAQGKQDHSLDVSYRSNEYPQGQFLRHMLDNGFTAIQWWDRCQGDTRAACNSTVLLEGEHTTDEMLEALRVNFPRVLENLKRHGVELVEVNRG